MNLREMARQDVEKALAEVARRDWDFAMWYVGRAHGYVVGAFEVDTKYDGLARIDEAAHEVFRLAIRHRSNVNARRNGQLR